MKGTFVFRSLVLVCAFLALSSIVMADARPGGGLIRDHFLTAQPSVRQVAGGIGQQPGSMEVTSIGPTGLKSPGKALLLSAVLPGAGEFYGGAWKRGAIFSAAEVASWTWYFTQHSSGKDKESEYMDFADVEWDEPTYKWWYNNWLKWYEEQGGSEDEFAHLFTHHLPDQVDSDYYEMIGKYDQFSIGWVADTTKYLWQEFAPNDTIWIHGQKYGFDATSYNIARGADGRATINRDKYADMRGDANTLLKRATWGISAALFNHVISALDAALVAKAFNRRILEEAHYPKLRMELDMYAGEVIPKFTITQKF
ncbi:hypothetical protein ACFL0G_01710 [Candidatus Zixiibacteriota bacterium]